MAQISSNIYKIEKFRSTCIKKCEVRIYVKVSKKTGLQLVHITKLLENLFYFRQVICNLSKILFFIRWLVKLQ